MKTKISRKMFVLCGNRIFFETQNQRFRKDNFVDGNQLNKQISLKLSCIFITI